MSACRRIGVFGGAFDPPHLGHVALVASALQNLALDEVRVLPTGQAWHRAKALSSGVHRMAMVQRAFANWPQVHVDPRELERQGPTYTVDTLQSLAVENPDAQLYLLLGGDQLQALSSWHRVGDIARLAIICAAARDSSVAPWNAGDSPAPLPESLLSGLRRLPMPLVPISATDIRQRLAHHQPVSDLVPAEVARYIDQHHLYGPAA